MFMGGKISKASSMSKYFPLRISQLGDTPQELGNHRFSVSDALLVEARGRYFFVSTPHSGLCSAASIVCGIRSLLTTFASSLNTSGSTCSKHAQSLLVFAVLVACQDGSYLDYCVAILLVSTSLLHSDHAFVFLPIPLAFNYFA